MESWVIKMFLQILFGLLTVADAHHRLNFLCSISSSLDWPGFVNFPTPSPYPFSKLCPTMELCYFQLYLDLKFSWLFGKRIWMSFELNILLFCDVLDIFQECKQVFQSGGFSKYTSENTYLNTYLLYWLPLVGDRFLWTTVVVDVWPYTIS